MEDHHIQGAIEADRILGEAGYPGPKIERVKACILTHRGSVSLMRETKEQQCVADADAIAHIQCVPSLFFVAYHKLGMDIATGESWVREKLRRDWQKLSDTGKELVRRKYEAVLEILQ